MDFLQFFKAKRVLLTLGLLAASFLTSEYSLQTSAKQNELSNLRQGLGTCFSRVSQTYTAKILGDSGSGYLTSAFLAATEECFGDAMGVMEDNFEYTLASTFKLLNTVASDTHWFHEKISKEATDTLVGSDVVVTNFGARFSTIEDSRYKVLEGFDNLKESLDNKINYLRFLFWVLITSTVGLMLFEILSKKHAEYMMSYYEEQATDFNSKYNKISIPKVEELLNASLENSKLLELNKLINKIGLNGQVESEKDPDEYIAPRVFETGSVHQNLDEEINQAWEVGPVATDNALRSSRLTQQYEKIYSEKLDVVHLDNILARVVNLTSNRLFTRGIALDFDIDDELYVYADEESLEQVFYHVLTNSFKDLDNKEGLKKIRVSVRSLGGSLLLCFEDNGVSFSKTLLKIESGLLGSITDKDSLSTELEICRAFMNDFGGSVLFENTYDKAKNAVGKKIKLVFKAARKPLVIESVSESVNSSNGLTMVKTTTKKDFLADLDNKIS